MQLATYLSFDGQAEEAFKFYAKSLDGEIVAIMKYSDSPMADQTPEDQKNRVMHAAVRFGDQLLMGADAPPQYVSKPQGFCVSLSPNSAEDAERFFNALAENGTVQMPLDKTFFADKFGMLIDQYGVPWMVNFIANPCPDAK